MYVKYTLKHVKFNEMDSSSNQYHSLVPFTNSVNLNYT